MAATPPNRMSIEGNMSASLFLGLSLREHDATKRTLACRSSIHREGWAELALAHERFVEDYNAQAHFAHQDREDGRRSPSAVLAFVSGVRHREEELRRAFF
jgi:hypothetical protein